MPRVLGITPARLGSKRIPHKNTAMVAGKPLIAWTIEAALGSSLISEYVVNSDDNDVLFIAKARGAWTHGRPTELAQDDSPTLPVLQHSTKLAELENNEQCDIIVHLPCTNPLKTAADIDACIQMLIDTGADSVIAVHRILDAHPARVQRIEGDRLLPFHFVEPTHGQSQLYEPPAYVRSGAIYALTRDAVMGNNARLFGHADSRAYILPPSKAVNIDEPADLYAAEYLLKERMKQCQ